MLTLRGSHHLRGSAHPASVLDEDSVHRIKVLLRDGFTLLSIAREFGVTAPTIRAIRDGKTWKHVPDPPATPTFAVAP